MSERLGAIKLGAGQRRGRSSAATWATSATTPRRSPAIVDEEVKKLIETAHDEAWEILVENRDVLDDAGRSSCSRRRRWTRSRSPTIFAPVRKRPQRPAWTGSQRRGPRDRPPVLTPGELAPGQRRPTAARRRSHGQPPADERVPASGRARSGSRPAPTERRPPRDGDQVGLATPRSRRRTEPDDSGRAGRTGPPESPPTPARAVRTVRPEARRGGGPRAAATRSARTPTATACGTPRPGWRGPTREMFAGLWQAPRTS